jgi:hypothetical protein
MTTMPNGYYDDDYTDTDDDDSEFSHDKLIDRNLNEFEGISTKKCKHLLK